MPNWSHFAVLAPELAAYGAKRLQGRIAYLATLLPDGSPRLHPVSPVIAGGSLFVYMEPTSPKGRDLLRDGRYALHCAVEDKSGGEGEFLVRGYAAEVADARVREEAFGQARAIGYNPQDRYVLFELAVTDVQATLYESHPPKRMRWKAS